MSRHPYSSERDRAPRDKFADAEHWPWPEITQPQAEPAREQQALNIKRRVEVAAPEPMTEPEPEPLTAEALEAIRQAAYEEGFEQGKQEGLIAGQEEGRLTGLQQGHEAGLKQGLAEGHQQIEQQHQQWQQLLEQLQAPLAQIDQVVEQSLVTLAQELARNLLKTEATTSPQLLLATVREAVAALPGHEGDVTLFLHPDDMAIIEQHFDEKSRRQRRWELVSEPDLARGDLRVKTALSELDVSLALRIDELMANFIKANWNRFHDTL